MGETELARMVVRLEGNSTDYQRMLLEVQQQTLAVMTKIAESSQKAEQAITGAGVVGAVSMVVAKLKEYKDRVIGFFKEGFGAFSEAEEVLINLQAMLGANGRDVEALTARYQRFANEQIALLAVSDEQILQNLRTAESFGLTGDAAESAVSRATGLARIVGSSTDSMMRLEAAMTKGDTKMAMRFARMVPQLRGIKNETEFIEKYNKLWVAGLEAAEKSAQTTAGRIKVLKEEWGNFMEEVGAVISPMVLPFVEAARVGVAKLQAFMAPIFSWIKEQWKTVESTAVTAWSYIQTKAKAFYSYMYPIVGAWYGYWKATWGLVYDVAELVWRNLYNVAEGFFKFATSVFEEWFGVWEVAWDDIQSVAVDVFVALEWALKNWKNVAAFVLDYAKLKFVQFVEEVKNFIINVAPKLALAVAQAYTGNYAGALRSARDARLSLQREVGEFERNLQASVDRQAEALSQSFSQFRSLRREELFGLSGGEDDDLVEQGRHEEEKRNEGRLKEMQKFDAVLRQSAEARSRIQEYADRISRDRTERANGGPGGGQASDSRAAAVATQSVEARVRESNQLLRRVADNTQRIASQPQIVVEDADLV